MPRVAALAMLALLLAAAPPAPAQAPPEPHVTDPTGDATWLTTQDAHMSTYFTCGLAGQPGYTACGAAPPPPEAGGAPAPPALDLVHARFEADGETLRVELALASLDHTFAGAPAGDELIAYSVCWKVADQPCGATLGLSVIRVRGVLSTSAFVGGYTGPCAKAGGCWFAIDHEVVPGTPGYVRFDVPRATLDPGVTVLSAPAAYSFHASMPAGYTWPSYHVRARDIEGSGWGGAFVTSMTDETGPGTDFPLPPPARAFTPEQDSRAARPDATGDTHDARADLDLLETTYHEDERTFTLSFELARVDDTPADHHFYLTLTPSTGAAVVAGYTASGGARATYSGACGSGCGPNPSTPLKKPAEFEIVSGEPGWVNVTFARTDLGRPGHGDFLAYLYAGFLLPEAVRQQGPPDARVVDINAVLGDYVWEAHPWWFQLGAPREEADASAFLVEDDIGDLETSDPALTAIATVTSLDAFDITSLKVDPLPDGQLRVELGILDLSTVRPPNGFSAVLYAAAIATEQGSFMVGYYDDEARREFFCAPDTAVLSKPERDPNEVIWQSIEGLLSVARDRGQSAGGGSAPGSIIFLAPYSCFLEEQSADIAAETIAAGTFLMQGTSEEGISVQSVDSVASDGGVTLAAAQVAAPPFWAQPFGIQNFWDITGIVVAALVALAGAVALRRKQGALRRYLHEIEHVLREHTRDARAREAALVVIQDRLKADLLKNRITESHFVIVERRLDQHLAKVRVQALADVFGDLPHRLLVTLQDLLRDGAMDREDWQLFRTQLAAEPHLTSDVRASIEQRVERWVRDHAPEPAQA